MTVAGNLPQVGVGVVLFRDKNVLLVQRSRPPRAGEWSIPGGRQQLGETVIAAARRELFEETGLSPAGRLVLVDVVDSIDRAANGAIVSHYTLIDFTAHAAAGEARPGGDSVAVCWAALRDLPSFRLWSRTQEVIAEAARRLGVLAQR